MQTGETQHAVYLTTLSVRAYHIHRRERGERIAEKEGGGGKASFLRGTMTELFRVIYATQRSRRRGRAHSFMCPSHSAEVQKKTNTRTHTLGFNSDYYNGYLPIRDLNPWLSANSKYQDINILRSVTDSVWCARRPIISSAVTWILCLYIYAQSGTYSEITHHSRYRLCLTSEYIKLL